VIYAEDVSDNNKEGNGYWDGSISAIAFMNTCIFAVGRFKTIGG